MIDDYLLSLDKNTITSLSTQNGTSKNDTLIGTNILNGIDTLYGKDGDDTLVGGIGNDFLQGDKGSDTYVFKDEFGSDIINNFDEDKTSKDTTSFTDNTKKEDLSFLKQSNNLIISKKDTNNQITIQDFFKDDVNLNYTIDELKLKDGTILTGEQIVDIIFTPTNGDDDLSMFYANKDYSIDALDGDDTIITKNGKDTIYAGRGDDRVESGANSDSIYGEEGDDNIYGGDGDDIINGGSGDDFLQGGEGDDTYVFDGNFGNDTILNFKPNQSEQDAIIFKDLNSSQIRFSRVFEKGDINSDLLIKTIHGDIKVLDFFDEKTDINASYKINKIQTKDTTLSIDDIKTLVTTPSNNQDIIQAHTDINIVNGGYGDDILKPPSTQVYLMEISVQICF